MDQTLVDAVPRFWMCKYDMQTSIEGPFCPICGRTREAAEYVEMRGTFQVAAVLIAHVNEKQRDDDT